MKDARWVVAAVPCLVASILFTWISVMAYAACACKPDFCQDDQRVADMLQQQKKNLLLKSGYPAKLVALLDIDDQWWLG